MCDRSIKIKEQSGYTLLETMMVMSVLTIILGASFGLLEVSRLMDTMAQDGFRAQDESRQVLTKLAKHLRPAENMSAPGVPLLHAGADGASIDVKVDVDGDGEPEIVRFELDLETKQIMMRTDKKENGKYNYQATSGDPAEEDYLDYYSDVANWDKSVDIANKIVNAPKDGASGWSPQVTTTNPKDDYRLFTFYGADFDAPLDTVELGSVWVNYVRGVKIFLLSDIQPASIPSPFGIETNVHLRNIAGE
jgi:prepilin-type N-terminal cleavage/methylation domain-containing protein